LSENEIHSRKKSSSYKIEYGLSRAVTEKLSSVMNSKKLVRPQTKSGKNVTSCVCYVNSRAS